MVNATTPIIYTYQQEVPLWVQVILGILTTTTALLLTTCLFLCCMRLCGCWTGNIFGLGQSRRHTDDGDHIGCWCCNPTPFLVRHDLRR